MALTDWTSTVIQSTQDHQIRGSSLPRSMCMPSILLCSRIVCAMICYTYCDRVCALFSNSASTDKPRTDFSRAAGVVSKSVSSLWLKGVHPSTATTLTSVPLSSTPEHFLLASAFFCAERHILTDKPLVAQHWRSTLWHTHSRRTITPW